MANLIKHSGQVFTPDYLVNLILDEAGYFGPTILRKHCMENSCGDGAFLCEIVSRYITAFLETNNDLQELSSELHTYIHGIELDPVAYNNCLVNLKSICQSRGVDCTTFDVRNVDTLSTSCFDNKMDFVIGNPPYVRVHNLEDSYTSVKSFSFANGGMTDLFLVFFEKGLQMLKDGGKLCYITPGSWLNSVAGGVMREYIRNNHNLVSLIDLEHFQAFKATTYTLISLFQKGVRRETFSYNVFNTETFGKKHIENLTFSEIDINSYFYLSNHNTLESLRDIFSTPLPKYVSVKNGFATLADKVFISDSFPFKDFIIPTIKASTGKWYYAFFPYDAKGKPLSFSTIFENDAVASYLHAHKSELLKNSTEEENQNWYLFGRTQALKDVAVDKLAINTTIKDIKSLKINFVPSGSGLYSGLYILSDVDFSIIEKILRSDKFISYIASLKKYKSGGYYTYNSKDLETYLNYQIQKLVENETIQLPSTEQYGLFACNF